MSNYTIISAIKNAHLLELDLMKRMKEEGLPSSVTGPQQGNFNRLYEHIVNKDFLKAHFVAQEILALIKRHSSCEINDATFSPYSSLVFGLASAIRDNRLA